MKRYVAFFILLVIVDLVAETLIDLVVPVGQVWWLGKGVMLSVGNLHHYVSYPLHFMIGQLSFVGMALICLALGWIYNLGVGRIWLSRWMGIAATLFGVEWLTQSIDALMRGYTVDYFGWGNSALNYGEMLHLGDMAVFAAWLIMSVSFARLGYDAAVSAMGEHHHAFHVHGN